MFARKFWSQILELAIVVAHRAPSWEHAETPKRQSYPLLADQIPRYVDPSFWMQILGPNCSVKFVRHSLSCQTK
ncbi:uncharacterized protein BKA78DRAFT_323819 [Phyllosticta capitalensis]|uniref:uncharacterized protein n=1 Tax=Phyllosticta capitalensis TaxID=121624 RepID=UPI0031325906